MVAIAQSLHRAIGRRPMVRKVLLGCGVVSSAWWVAVDVLASRRYPGYSYTDQVISELSAEGAPTRPFLLAVNAVPYAALTAAFGAGVGTSTPADRARAGRIVEALLVGGSLVGSAGGVLFPMQMRENKGTLRNAMHIPYGALSVLQFLLTMGVGSTLLGQRFRYYTYGTLVTVLVFGVLTGVQSARIATNQPTPWLGIEERVGVYATMLWFAVLAIGLVRGQGAPARAA